MVMRVDELDATIQMTLYTDDSYSDAYSSAPTIELGDKWVLGHTVSSAQLYRGICSHTASARNCNSISKREVVKADPTLGLLSYTDDGGAACS
ncbi:hypothetical protein FQN60_014023, partial [Etheostoma spectabile]